MIIDYLKNVLNYNLLAKDFSQALDFIAKNDVSKLSIGKYSIDGNRVYALVQEYETKSLNIARLESHFRYIDLQYMISGEEQMGFASLSEQKPSEIRAEKDIAFYDDKCTLLPFKQNMFAVFYPNDLHMPGVALENSVLVKKLVIKILVE